MGTIAQKLQYTVNAVDDIQKALEEKGFDMTDVELSRYGDLIRLITGSSVLVEEEHQANHLMN